MADDDVGDVDNVGDVASFYQSNSGPGNVLPFKGSAELLIRRGQV